jgi:tetratricopeptide (TPR) repeat protein
MRVGVFIILLLIVFNRTAGQQVNIDPIVHAWKTDDITQTKKSAVYYDQVDFEKDTSKFFSTLATLQDYIDKNPNKRVKARILMYEVFGAMVFLFPGDKYKRLLEEAMQIASELDDDQLMAEIYVYYAEVTGSTNQLLYNLKAIEIQRRIGFRYFNTVHNRFFVVSNALYHSKDYRQSIQYGLECLRFVGTDQEHWLKRVYILQLDILGAAYKQLGLCDSTVYYYQKILDTLHLDPEPDYMQTLWTGIAKGNIGHCLSLRKNYAAALPLMKEYAANSREVKDWANVAIAENFLAGAYYSQGEYDLALASWKQTFAYSDTSSPTNHLLNATRGMAEIYKRSGKMDSAFHFYDLYHEYADTIDQRLGETKLSAVNARLAFENLQAYLSASETKLIRSRNILQVTIGGVVLLGIISWLLYNRHRLKYRHRLEMINRKNELAEQSVENAKKQIAGFMDYIREKNNIIDSMERQIQQSKESQESRMTLEKLSQYVLVSEEEWEKFRTEFSQAYPEFFKKLRERIPQLTPSEERLSALIFLKINNFQIAKMLGIERDSVFRARRRLKQRLELPEAVVLDDYLLSIL